MICGIGDSPSPLGAECKAPESQLPQFSPGWIASFVAHAARVGDLLGALESHDLTIGEYAHARNTIPEFDGACIAIDSALAQACEYAIRARAASGCLKSARWVADHDSTPDPQVVVDCVCEHFDPAAMTRLKALRGKYHPDDLARALEAIDGVWKDRINNPPPVNLRAMADYLGMGSHTR